MLPRQVHKDERVEVNVGIHTDGVRLVCGQGGNGTRRLQSCAHVASRVSFQGCSGAHAVCRFSIAGLTGFRELVEVIGEGGHI